jgi:FixJ family two-component response regulator
MISVIDDNRSFREAVRSLVRSIGCDAVTFASAEEYLGSDRVHASQCVIADVNMPAMSGIALRERLIANGYHRPIILMSARLAEKKLVPVRQMIRQSPF